MSLAGSVAAHDLAAADVQAKSSMSGVCPSAESHPERKGRATIHTCHMTCGKPGSARSLSTMQSRHEQLKVSVYFRSQACLTSSSASSSPPPSAFWPQHHMQTHPQAARARACISCLPRPSVHRPALPSAAAAKGAMRSRGGSARVAPSCPPSRCLQNSAMLKSRQVSLEGPLSAAWKGLCGDRADRMDGNTFAIVGAS